MNSVRFELQKFFDCCYTSVSICRASASVSCNSTFRAIFKDRGKRPQIFIYLNLCICALNVLTFGIKHTEAITRGTENIHRWIFVAVTVVAWIMAVGLIYAVKRRKPVFCQLWCLGEIGIIVAYLIMTLREYVYLKLLVKSSPDRQHDREPTPDGSKITYFVVPPNKRAMMRRETDQTSIGSSPPSQSGDEQEECNDSVLDDTSPTRASFQFFDNEKGRFEPQYSEIMLQGNSHDLLHVTSNSTPQIASSSKDNIIISDLMCGGSSTLNVELER